MQVSHDARELLVSGPSRVVICCMISCTKDGESHDERPQGTVGRYLRERPVGAIVLEPQTVGLEFWKFSAM